MPSGLLALVDDIAALAKIAASQLDDIAAQSAKAGSKAVGVVIDDAAVTPRYVVGFASDRELPIIRKIGTASLKNKLVILLPGALLLSYFAPWAIMPILMVGGAFLCLEGFHKAWELIHPHGPEEEGGASDSEQERVASAVRTDMILSAEIMAISLGGVSALPFWEQAVVLIGVGIGITFLVYGVVAIIVKADDAGMALAQSGNGAIAGLGRGIVAGMPPFLKVLSFVGMLAMLWVGGGIVSHGLHETLHTGPDEWIHARAVAAGHAVPALEGTVEWLVAATGAGVFGLALGGLVDLGVRGVKRVMGKS